MAWNTTAPDGTKSVSANNPILQANTTYTKTTMNVDHYWNIGINEDGHHKFVQTVATNDSDKTVATNPTLATGMDLVYYSRFKTASESVDQQDCQPFALTSATDVMQVLGIRACVLFNVSGGTATIKYQHNVSSVSRTAQGKFTITYTNALPSTSYLVLGGGLRNNSNSNALVVSIQSTTSLSSTKGTGSCKILTVRAETGALTDPYQAWIMCFGG